MAFDHASAPFRQRAGKELSADNSRPERHIVIDILRRAAPLLGLKPPVIATLDAMLSCLPPKRSHHTVFASNATLAFRRDGLSDRTIRRHAAELLAAGLLVRHDSPNRKRFSRRGGDAALRFGFDLTPLFDRIDDLARLAAEADRQEEEIAYLRCKLRAAVNDRLVQDPADPDALETQKLLRRKLSALQIEALLEQLDTVEAEGPVDETQELSGSDGQNVRHLHNSNKEPIETKGQGMNPDDLTVGDIVNACPEATQFLETPVRTPQDIISHARFLAPMLGIEDRTYSTAIERSGPMRTALAIWAIVQMHRSIRNAGAYFRSLTCGEKAGAFDPVRLYRSLARQQRAAPGNCPRTTVQPGVFANAI